MRTKRFLSLLLAAAMTAAAALTLSSCKSDENSTSEKEPDKPAPSKFDVTGTWLAEVEAPGTVGGGGQMTYDHQVTACTFNSDGTGTWYRFMLTNDSGNPIALDGGAGHGDFTYSVGADGQIACRLTGSQAPAYYPASLALTLSNDTIAGREGNVAYKMSRASDIMARWITVWDRRLHGGGNSDETTGDIVDLSTLTGDMEARNGQTLTGTLACNVKVSIADGATVTLRDATINGRNKNAFRWAGITCPGNATLVLEGANSVRGFQRMFPGIHIAQGKTLTIQGSGSLDAGSNGNGAGIGGGSSIDCGSIVIEGGTISAEGGNEAAGIGGGAYAACGNITITSDVTSLTAIKGDGAQHSVGAGADGTCGTVTIGDRVGAISSDTFTFPVAVTGVTLSQTEATLAVGETLTLTATMIPEYAANFGASNVTWSSSDEAVATVNESGVVTAKSPGEATITVTTADGGYTATCTVTVSNTQDLALLTNHFTAPDGITLTGTLGANVKISIANGATVTLRNATINGEDYFAYWAGITCLGDATIVIKGENIVRGFQWNYPGIYIPKGSTLTIRGDGSLTASSKNRNSSSCGAGIGGGYFMECGNIVIEGGTINATGGRQAAGIGGGAFSGCGNITITSGVTSVTATKGDRCPYSIGGGEQGWCGTVTIGGKETGQISQSPYTYKP